MNVFSDIIRAMYPVSDESIGKLWAHAEIITLQKGEFLIKDGTVNRNLYLIKSGLLRSFHLEGDREDTLWFATDGDAVASMHSIFAKSPAIADIIVLTETTLFQIPWTTLETLYEQCHDLANWGRRIAEEELYCLEHRYRILGTGDAYSRFRAFMNLRPNSFIREIPLKDIASYLGMTPQTLSKLRARYAAEK